MCEHEIHDKFMDNLWTFVFKTKKFREFRAFRVQIKRKALNTLNIFGGVAQILYFCLF